MLSVNVSSAENRTARYGVDTMRGVRGMQETMVCSAKDIASAFGFMQDA